MDPLIGEVNWSLVGPWLAAALAPVVTYLVAVRKMSGKIGSSDAEQLWEESRAIRADYRTQLLQANERTLAIRADYRTQLLQANERTLSLEHRVAGLDAMNVDLARENRDLHLKVDELTRAMEAQRRTIAEHERTIASLNKQLNGGP